MRQLSPYCSHLGSTQPPRGVAIVLTERILERCRMFRDFRDQYARAREEQADKLFREIIEIADDASGDYVTTSDGKRIVDHENIVSGAPSPPCPTRAELQDAN